MNLPRNPPRWGEAELETDRRTALALFIDERTKSAGPEYTQQFDACVRRVAALFDATGDLSLFDPAKLADPSVLDAARFLAVPPWSEDDLKTVSGAAVTRRRRLPPQVLSEAIRVLRVGWDPIRFPWITQHRRSTPEEREIAIRWTASIWAIERLRTEARMKGSRQQQQAVETLLSGVGYTKLSIRKIEFPHHLPVKHFAGETILGDTKCDVAVRLGDERLLPIECKVSNSSLNSVKRLIRESGGKARRWQAAFGEVVVPAVVLSGVYKLRHLIQAQVTYGLSIFWAHNLEPLRQFVESG